MMKKTLLHLLFAASITGQSIAQELPYTISVLNQPYTTLDEGISLTNNQPWDDPEVSVPLGFTFQFIDEVVTSMLITGSGSLIMSELDETMLNFFSPFADDVIDIGYFSGENLSPMRYQVVGNPGSRICKMEWYNVGFYYELEAFETSNNRVSFQVWLYEGSNVIEFRYGPNSIKKDIMVHDLGAPFAFIAKNVNFFTGVWDALWVLGGNPQNPIASAYSDPEGAPGPELLYSSELPDGLVHRFTPTFVSVSEITKNNALAIYPTKTNNLLNIIWSGYATSANLVDLNGRVVQSFSIANGRNTLDVTDLSSGMYMISILDQTSAHSVKFIKE